MTTTTNSLDLFHYTDYRLYLRDWYAAAKKRRGSFSFRTFSKRAGFRSPNFYKLVMDGSRNLTETSLSQFVVGLGLNKQEEEFFRNLVFFNQAKTHARKNLYYQRLLQSRKFNQLKPVERYQYEFYSTWYHPVVRELVSAADFDGTPEWLAVRIFPAITPMQAKKSLELLEVLGLIVQDKDGAWKQKHVLLSTGAESDALQLLNYHSNLLGLAKDLLPQIPAAQRDISALTLGVAQGRVAELKARIRDFRKDILKLVSEDTEPQSVVMLAIQLFPVTRLEKEKK